MKIEIKEETNDYFDFVDFFDLIKDSCSSSIYGKNIFYDLTYYVYDLAKHYPLSEKDDMTDILQKRKAFKASIINVLSYDLIDDIANSYQDNLLSNYVENPELLANKVIFRAKKDNRFFSKKDIEALDSYKDNPGKVLAYVLIVTMRHSKEAKKMQHDKDFNPFKDYVLPEEGNTNTLVNSNTTMFTQLKTLSLFQYDNYALLKSIKYDSDLLSKGSELYNTSKIRTAESLNLKTTYDEISVSSLQNNQHKRETIQDLNAFFKECKHMLIYGEGGVGKTTYLYSLLQDFSTNSFQKAIPIYVKLANCSTMTDHRHMIITEIIKLLGNVLSGGAMPTYKDILDEFNKETSSPEYILLLDGFNEITPIDYGEIRTAISKEINDMTDMPNVKIVLTSRSTNFYSLYNENFLQVEAKGIEKKDILNYLSNYCEQKELDRITNNADLLSCLRIPLFLLMFKERIKYNKTPQNRGSILYNYYNNSTSFYNEKLNSEEKTERKLAFAISILLDFVLPDLGFYMEENNLFSVSRDTFINIIDNSCETIKKYATLALPAFKRYDVYPGGLFHAATLLQKEISIDDLFTICADFIDVLYRDSSYDIAFNHQYIRDYFSAVYCLRSIYYGVESNYPNDILSNALINPSIETFDRSRYEIIEEVFPAFSNDFQKKDLFFDAIKVCQGTVSDNNGYINGYVLPVLIQLLSDTNHGDLSSYDFTDLNISSCNLANKNFSNPFTNMHSDFSGSLITDSTFAKSAHVRQISKWNFTSDKKHIISIDWDYIVKIWNIASQTCVYSVQLPSYGKLAFNTYELDVFYNKYDAFILVAYYNNSTNIETFATYNLSTSCYTEYKISNEIVPDNENYNDDTSDFVHCGYDISTERLYAISETGILYYYSLDDEIPDVAIRLNHEFVQRIQTHYLKPEDLFHTVKGKTKKIVFLPDNQILYLESDVYGNYFHAIDDIVYKGDDFNHSPVDVFPLEDIKDNSEYPTRHINIFIYDINTHQMHDLQLDGYEDITSLAIPGTHSDDVIEKYITISADRKLIALHNVNDIFTYNIDDKDYTFKVAIRNIQNISGTLSFRHENNNILSLFNEGHILQYDLSKSSLVYKKTLGHSMFLKTTVCNDKYLISEVTYNVQGAFQITNIYTGEATSMSISTNQLVKTCYHNTDYVYVVYVNGTVATLDINTLELINLYNYCPDKHVIDTCYDPSHNCLCILCSPSHSFLFSDRENIIHINLTTGETVESLSVFHSLKKIYYVDNGNYIIAAGYSLILLDTDTMTQQDILNPNENNYDTPIDLFDDTKNNQFHILFPAIKHVGTVDYNAALFSYEINNNKCAFKKKRYIPEINPSQDYEDTKLIINPLEESSICIFKSAENTDHEITYLIRTDDDSQDTCFEKSSLNQWNLAYIDADKVTDDIFIIYREEDIIIISSINDENPLCRTAEVPSDLYVWNKAANTRKNLLPPFNLADYSYNQDKMCLYCYNTTDAQLQCYDFTLGKNTIKGPKIHPSMLIQNCIFDEHIKRTYIPTYLSHNDNDNIEYDF